MTIDIVKHNKVWLIISVAVASLAAAALIVWGIRFGIDFRGGSILDYRIEGEQEQIREELNSMLSEAQVSVSQVTLSEGNTYSMFVEPLSEEKRREIETKIESTFQSAERLSVETIGPSVGEELKRQAILAVIVSNIVVILFLAFTFRKVPLPAHGWEFGVAAVIAMLYDVVVVLGVFAVLGEFLGIEIDSLFVTAVLTVMGFSIHDSIVVFDRIRENLRRRGGEDFKATINKSLIETLARSMNLSASVLIVLLSLLLIGGDSIRWFIFALFIGLLSGSYSSVFVASQVLVWWEGVKEKYGL